MKRQYDDDDGRTIADMSDVSRPSFASGWISRRGEENLRKNRIDPQKRSSVPEELDPREQRAAVLGALGAALLIGLLFLGAFAAAIALMLAAWG